MLFMNFYRQIYSELLCLLEDSYYGYLIVVLMHFFKKSIWVKIGLCNNLLNIEVISLLNIKLLDTSCFNKMELILL
jgi:hypothetical protein